MKPTNKDRLILLIIFVVAIYMFFATCYGTYKLFAQDNQDNGEVIFIDHITGTQYLQKSKYIEIKGTDGYTSYIGTSGELDED